MWYRRFLPNITQFLYMVLVASSCLASLRFRLRFFTGKKRGGGVYVCCWFFFFFAFEVLFSAALKEYKIIMFIFKSRCPLNKTWSVTIRNTMLLVEIERVTMLLPLNRIIPNNVHCRINSSSGIRHNSSPVVCNLNNIIYSIKQTHCYCASRQPWEIVNFHSKIRFTSIHTCF